MDNRQEQLDNRARLIAQILGRYNYLFIQTDDGYRIGSPGVRFKDFGLPLFYTMAGIFLGVILFRIMGPTEGIVITCASLLGAIYTWLLYHSKVQLSKTAVEISAEGLLLIQPDGVETFLYPAGIARYEIVLDPEEKVKTGRLLVVDREAGELELLKLVGETQKYIHDDLEKVRDFIDFVLDRAKA